VIKNILFGVNFLILLGLVITGCKTESAAPPPPAPVAVPQAAQPAPPAPVAQPAPTPAPAAAPPRTDLVPVEQPAAPASVTAKHGKGKGGGNVDAAISGPKTEGDELLGNYSCQITSNEFPMGLNPPASGCKIFKDGSGKLRIGPTGGIGIKGTINDPKAKGFHIVGKYNVGIGSFNIKTRMLRQGASKNFAGRGKGYMNNNKDKQMKYKLTMTRL
jgi:hypothetical protein